MAAPIGRAGFLDEAAMVLPAFYFIAHELSEHLHQPLGVYPGRCNALALYILHSGFLLT
jgi:hypothetical protein